MSDGRADDEGDEIRRVSYWPGNPVSYTTTNLRLFFNGTLLSTATGFVLRFAQHYGLVTNWHVLSGRSPIDGSCLSATGGIPNRLEFHVALGHRKEVEGKSAEAIYFKPLDISLHDQNDNPIWYEDRGEGSENDFVVIPLEPIVPELAQEGYYLRALQGGNVTLRHGSNASQSGLQKIHPDDLNYFYPPVGHQVFIVGYPAGIEPAGVFPIWKGGTIASEPSAGVRLRDSYTTDVFFVDGLTRSGMSGAPVICLQKVGDKFFTDDGVWVSAEKAEPLLIGVYAGREGVTEKEADLALGRVWKVGAVEKLFTRIAHHAAQNEND